VTDSTTAEVATSAVPALPALAELNEMPATDFAARLGPLFEHAPRFLARLAAERPFSDWDDLFDRAAVVALAMPEPDQVELLDSHVRLGADAAATRARSRLSYQEQGYEASPGAAPDSNGSAAEARTAAELERLNAAYEARFGFRYVVFVAGRSRAELLPGMAAALRADRGAELGRGLRDVVAIARDRRARLAAVGGER
jgi:2-oxo-4-hydroxy-4-carboxy-5-ureidoimidazoline decarboxylase